MSWCAPKSPITSFPALTIASLLCNLPWRCPNSCTAISKPPNAMPPNMSPFALKEKWSNFCLWGGNYQAKTLARCANRRRKTSRRCRGAMKPANNRSGNKVFLRSNPISKSYLAEALLMRREIAGAEAALQDAFTFVERSGERFLARRFVPPMSMVRSPSGVRNPTEHGPKPPFLKATDIARSQEARIAQKANCGPATRPCRGYGARQERPTIPARC